MDKKDNLLWHVLSAITNSPNDVWKEEQYGDDGEPKHLLGNPKRRFTVPVLEAGQTSEGINIYLVIQFSTDYLDFPCFVIDKKAFTEDLKAKEEYVYAINARLCLESEFLMKHRKQLNNKGIVKDKYRTDILNKTLELIEGTTREKVLRNILYSSKYKGFTSLNWNQLINRDQFGYEENIYKGLDMTDDKNGVE